MEKMIEIPKELIKEANRLGLNYKLLALRVLRRTAETLATAEKVLLSGTPEALVSRRSRMRRRS